MQKAHYIRIHRPIHELLDRPPHVPARTQLGISLRLLNSLGTAVPGRRAEQCSTQATANTLARLPTYATASNVSYTLTIEI